MGKDKEKVILFPKWRLALEEESLEALKDKRYEEALSKLDQLLDFKIVNHEIIIGKLICLMELGRHEEAQDLCEEAMGNRDEDYYHYVHIYLTILFQTNQYKELMDQVDIELTSDDIPFILREQFQQLYDISSKMIKDSNNEEAEEYIKDFYKAIENDDYMNQWRLVNQLQKLKANPNKRVIDLLKAEDVHPVIKTAIFQWLQEQDFSEIVDIQKLGNQLHVNPSDMIRLNEHFTVIQTKELMAEVEQKNPSLFRLLIQLIERYTYVRYPLLPPNEDVMDIAKAVYYIGENMLNIQTDNGEELNDNQHRYVKEIQMCEQLYLSIIED